MTCRPCLLALLIACAAVGCTAFPELDERGTSELRAAGYPDLLPIEELTRQPGIRQIDAGTQPALEARVNALKARAARLRGTVIDQNARNRLSQRPVVNETG